MGNDRQLILPYPAPTTILSSVRMTLSSAILTLSAIPTGHSAACTTLSFKRADMPENPVMKESKAGINDSAE